MLGTVEICVSNWGFYKAKILSRVVGLALKKCDETLVPHCLWTRSKKGLFILLLYGLSNKLGHVGSYVHMSQAQAKPKFQ